MPLPGATGDTYRALERRIAAAADGWQITIVPPLGVFPEIRFAGASETLDAASRDAVLLAAWEAKRWNVPALGIPGLPVGDPPAKPTMVQRRALVIAELVNTQQVATVAVPAQGRTFKLTVPRLASVR